MKRYIISLGGSIIVPDKIDIKFLKNFRKVVRDQAKTGKKFLILPGGGATARNYQSAARKAANVSDAGLDWIGIETNWFHAQFVRWILGAKKHEPVMTYKNFAWHKEPLMVALGGIKPGGSSDSSSINYARKLNIKTVINLTNVDGVFDRDPRKFKNAKLIPFMTWRQFRAQFGASRKPGQHKPFDPSIAKLAEKSGIEVVIINGRNLKNLKDYLSGKKFKGTVIVAR